MKGKRPRIRWRPVVPRTLASTRTPGLPRFSLWYHGSWRHDCLIQIEVHPNESIDAALKRFNMKLQQSGLLREVKEHAHYEKPSEKRRRQRRRRLTRQ